MWSYAKMTIWAVIWLVIWIFIAPFRKNRENCLTWAMDKFDKKGGYLVIRWCRTNKIRWIQWPHFLWLPEEHHSHLQHMIPKDKDHSEKRLPSPWFEGKVKGGDRPTSKDEN